MPRRLSPVTSASGHGDLSPALRLGGHGTRHAPDAACQYHSASDPPWTLQQLREAIPAEHAYRFLIHDRDAIFSQELDRPVGHLGLKVLKTPPQSPQANALCERLVGTIRRECLDFMIPPTEHHLRRILRK
jgi:putative transposase